MALNNVKLRIKEHGKNVSENQLIRDIIQDFLDNKQEMAIKKYT